MSLFLKNVGQRFGDKQALTGITATLEANGVIGLIGQMVLASRLY